jgi:hypothetical protein
MEDGINARLVVALQADISQLRRAFAEAGKAADGALLGIEQRTVRTKQKLEQNLELIKLTQQLDVARIAGNSKLVSKLTEEVMLRKTINTLVAQGVKAEEARGIAHAHVQALEKARGGREGVGGALLSTFERARLGVFEEGGAKIGIFGGALEKIGPAGFAAAAGIAALAIAAEGAHKAMEWTEELERSAKQIGVSTDALQEYHHVAQQFGIDSRTMDEGLKGLNESLGKMQSGIRAQRTLPFFNELKISRAELANIHNAAELIPVLTEHFHNLDSEAKKVQLAKALGAEGLLPILDSTTARVQELRAEAHSLGLVMSEDLIKKGAEANKKFGEAADVIKTQMMVAFVELAPVVAQVAGWLEKAALAAGHFFSAFDHGSIEGLTKHLELLQKQRDAIAGGGVPGVVSSVMGAHTLDKGKALATYDSMIAMEGMRLAFAHAEKEGDPKLGKVSLGALKGPKAHKEHDGTPDAEKSAITALDEAEKRRLDAIAALTTDIYAHAEAEKKAVDAEVQKQADALSAELTKIQADQSIEDADKKHLAAVLQLTFEKDNEAADLKKRKIDNDAAAKQDQQDLERLRLISGLRGQILTSLIGMARTAEERRKHELDALQEQKDVNDEVLAAKRRDLQRRGDMGEDTSVLVKGVTGDQALSDKSYGLKKEAILKGTASPWEAWADGGMKSAAEVGEALQTEAVKGMDAFNAGLAESIANGKNLGDVMRSVFQSMEADLIKYLAKQAEIAVLNAAGSSFGIPFLGNLFGGGGHADGTDSSPGGWKMVGERGPELMNVKPGSTVISNANIRAMTQMPNVTGRSSGSVNNTFRIAVDVSGANGDAAVHAIAYRAAMQGAAAAVETSRRASAGWATQHQYERG